MAEPFYVASTRVEKIAGVHRRAHVATGASLDMGVHGKIREHYGLDVSTELPLPVDYIVASAAG